ncbi:MAG TPA: hypothetical protein ENG83_11340 [Nitrospirae bacterium]|nr:hypothetical protein BMS3Abin06_02111 [bacterium BMS3Abin06]HDH12768.1 hypothetical protein [Nitrospirota bacterium]HDZ03326.1 hypothetical protein [Nitrospirota bacterium]
MSKKPLKYLCFSIFIIFLACAPKPVIAPPPLYEGWEPTIDEVIAKAGDDIEVIKAIADIKIEKNNRPYSSVSASVLIKRPGQVHMRMYQLGILVRDFVIKDETLYVLTGQNDNKLKRLGRQLYNAIIWWDGYGSGVMHRKGEEYIIRTEDKEIHIDSATLLPVEQEIKTLNTNIRLIYENPVDNEGFWYPALIKIFVDDFTFTVKLKRLLKNPALGEFDFQIPARS